MIRIGNENPENGLRAITIKPCPYTTMSRDGSVMLILTRQEYAELERAMYDKAAEEAAESGDANTPWKEEDVLDTVQEDDHKTEAMLDAD